LSVVIDASVALAWALPDEAVDGLDSLFRSSADAAFHVPGHWKAEVANALLMSERRKRSTMEQVAKVIAVLETLGIAIDIGGTQDALRRVVPLARAHGLTVYDALYLELAERTGLPLASLDRELVAAAQAVGVRTLP
jgi:predicted nucleic acid-binding protein